MERFWSDPASQPKRAFRWLLFIGRVPAWLVDKVTKPSFNVTEAKHSYLNHTFYYPGRIEWETINLTLKDPVDPDAAATVMQMIEAAGYRFPLDPNETATVSKAGAVAAMGQFTLHQLDAEGRAIEEWVLRNAWIQNAKFGELAYESDDFVNIDLTIRYDFAMQTRAGRPVDLP